VTTCRVSRTARYATDETTATAGTADATGDDPTVGTATP